MSFGKRNGWSEGRLMVSRKQLAVCKVLRRTDRLLVLEMYETISMPYNFDIVLGEERLRCEFKSQVGLRLHASILPHDHQTDHATDDLYELTAVRAKWTAQTRGFLRN